MKLRFEVVGAGQWPSSKINTFTLVRDRWDDFRFRTTFQLHYRDQDDNATEIGTVKIAQFGMGDGGASTKLDSFFQRLSSSYFSLGQDREYYENLQKLSKGLGHEALLALQDAALDLGRFDSALYEPVMSTSLMRDLDATVVRSQFHWLALGSPARTSFAFEYVPRDRGTAPRQPLDFNVRVDSVPPTNVHVLIGSNGVGKSTLMRDFAASLRADADPARVGVFSSRQSAGPVMRRVPFDNVMTVAFSAFDTFPNELNDPDGADGDIPHHVVGLRSGASPRAESDLAEQFADSLRACMRSPRRGRWLENLAVLEEADSVLRAENLGRLLGKDLPGMEVDRSRERFEALSSGHKIAVLTMTSLVRYVEERTLVLIDEPETHLHPPLLSALVRVISNLSVERNGVAILATHSPVVLQDVPRSNVFVLRRDGDYMTATEPRIETFGESVSVLTSAVFGLDVAETGFHHVLEKHLLGPSSNDLSAELGGEGRAILRALQDTDEDLLD